MQSLKFSKSEGSEFTKTLRARVEAYFKTHNKSKKGNTNMVIKTIFMLSVFFVPIIILCTGAVSSTLWLFLLYIISGLGMAGIGMGVMHDAIHGAYSKNRKVNKYMGYTMNMIGANASVWKVQHNVLHHTYTNIDQADDDINAPFFLRFSPFAKRYWIQRFQYLYVWFFYGLSTVSWITIKDFVRAARYRKMGFFNKKHEFRNTILSIISWKALYYTYALVIPLIMVPLPIWVIILAFFSMHFITGLTISLIFQTAHVLPTTAFQQPDNKGIINNGWTEHQLITTSNYAPRSSFFSWLIGGLNYQIEHHLFPTICHVHYKNISKIVAKTAKEFGLPYLVNKTFVGAIWRHVKMLRQLGRGGDQIKIEQ